MENRDPHQPDRETPAPSVDARPTPTAQQQADLERYFRDTPQGRAQFVRFLQESPEAHAELIEFFRDDPDPTASVVQKAARLQQHLGAIPDGKALLQDWIAEKIRLGQPSLLEAVRVDTAIYASLMMKPARFNSGFRLLCEAVKLAWTHDTFFCQLLYRLRVRLFVRGVPILPTILHRLCMILDQVDIGDHVLIEPGVYMPHGKVVMDGIVHVGGGTTIAPWVTLGLTTSVGGPSIGHGVMIGTGAKILGPVTVGDGARIAANAVVVDDVPPRTTVAGARAAVVRVHDQHADPTLTDSSR